MTTTQKLAKPIPVHVRWMVRRDMAEVLAIDELSHEQPWSEEDFLRVLRQRNGIGMVAERGEKVVGYWRDPQPGAASCRRPSANTGNMAASSRREA